MGWADKYVEKLETDGEVKFRPHGNSMTPHVKSGQLCTVKKMSNYNVGDIVLCKVNGYQYLHFIKAERAGQFQIGNAHGNINGWTKLSNVFGKLIKIEE